jgi:hypothetical protein
MCLLVMVFLTHPFGQATSFLCTDGNQKLNDKLLETQFARPKGANRIFERQSFALCVLAGHLEDHGLIFEIKDGLC